MNLNLIKFKDLLLFKFDEIKKLVNLLKKIDLDIIIV